MLIIYRKICYAQDQWSKSLLAKPWQYIYCCVLIHPHTLKLQNFLRHCSLLKWIVTYSFDSLHFQLNGIQWFRGCLILWALTQLALQWTHMDSYVLLGVYRSQRRPHWRIGFRITWYSLRRFDSNGVQWSPLELEVEVKILMKLAANKFCTYDTNGVPNLLPLSGNRKG